MERFFLQRMEELRKRIVSVAPALPSTTENSSTLDPFFTYSLNVYIIISYLGVVAWPMLESAKYNIH
jgi:hypothetical protein